MVKLHRKYLKMIVNFHFLAVCADNHFGPTQFFCYYRVPGKGSAGRNIKITREKIKIQTTEVVYALFATHVIIKEFF